jgi:hypothetical protein
MISITTNTSLRGLIIYRCVSPLTMPQILMVMNCRLLDGIVLSHISMFQLPLAAAVLL